MGPPFDLDSVQGLVGYYHAIRHVLKKANVEIPETAPVLRNMLVDDENRMWVNVAVDRETSKWWMLGESGELLAKTALSDNEVICDIQNGYLYTKFFDSPGNSKVIKYSINLTER
jgi:hypothetical protein